MKLVRRGVACFKVYPSGVTTNFSTRGQGLLFEVYPALDCPEDLQERDLVLQGRPEQMSNASVKHRELPNILILTRHAQALPSLRIYVEHVGSAK